jgi:SHS2 domain-containing protein
MSDEQQGAGRPKFQVVAHTADWAIRVWGASLAQLLANAAYGMSSLLVDDLDTLPLDEERRIEVHGFDRESVLVEWLSELAYLAEREGLVFRQYELHSATPETVRATVSGARVPQMHKHIKAVTYHNLAVQESSGGLETEIVFDV